MGGRKTERRGALSRAVVAVRGGTRKKSGTAEQQPPKRAPRPQDAASPLSLVGLDPLDGIDIDDPRSRHPLFYRVRLGQQEAEVPATFAGKRAHAVWSGVFGQRALDQLLERSTHTHTHTRTHRAECVSLRRRLVAIDRAPRSGTASQQADESPPHRQ